MFIYIDTYRSKLKQNKEAADKALAEISDVLNGMLEISIKAASSTTSDSERQSLSMKYNQLSKKINAISSKTLRPLALFGDTHPSYTDKTSSAFNHCLVHLGAAALNNYLDAIDDLLADISLASINDDYSTLLSLGINLRNGKSSDENLRHAVINFTQKYITAFLSFQKDTSVNALSYTLEITNDDIIIGTHISPP